MSFHANIAPDVEAELRAAQAAEARGEAAQAFRHLEAAHVLGQASTRHHVRAHWAMLRWGLRQRDLREVWGQAIRLIGAATKTAFGLVPRGNTGGARISPWRSLPLDPEHARRIEAAQR